jgi:acyl dehydratase
LVHGGQRCVLHRPIPAGAELSTTAKVRALYDKGKGALAIIDTETKTAAGEHLFDTEWQIFYRGEGGFGGERGPEAPSYAPPEGRAADARLEMPTAETQALLYRLASSDLNPIHADPEVAQKVGFPKPILHGLCTFGHAGRAAINGLLGKDPHRLRSIEGRFTKPVFPGDTLVTELWKIAPGEAYYTTQVKERSEVVIAGGRVTFAD